MSKERSVPVERELDPSQLECEEAGEARMDPDLEGWKRRGRRQQIQ